jgi:hypothetical protein
MFIGIKFHSSVEEAEGALEGASLGGLFRMIIHDDAGRSAPGALVRRMHLLGSGRRVKMIP